MNRIQVRKKFEEIHARMSKVADAFPWENKEAYISWLAQTNEYVTYGTRILALTAGHFPMDKTPLAARFIQHATEERGHEKLLVNDAKALGTDLSKVPVIPEAEAFHKSVYFWIYQGRPGVIMGWILFLEGFAIRTGPMIYGRAEKAYGRSPTSFLRVHTEEDPDHVDKAFEVLDLFSEKEIEDIVHGLELYSALYTNICTAITARAQTKITKAA